MERNALGGVRAVAAGELVSDPVRRSGARYSTEGMKRIMKRLMFALAAMVPMICSSGCCVNRWLDKAFCQPCNAGHLVGGCWGGQCGLGSNDCGGCESGCSSCVRGQGEFVGKGEVIVEGQGIPTADCDCPNCSRRRGLFRHHRRGPVAGGPPTAQVAYPYYTTRAPRDFLNPNPRSIGR